MDKQIMARSYNQFWWVIFVLFVFWYILLYVYDWSSVPGITPIKLDNMDSVEPSIEESNTTIHGLREDSDTRSKPNSSMHGNMSSSNLEKPPNETESSDNDDADDTIVDLEGLEIEIECRDRFIYIHNLPKQFNDGLLKQCRSFSKWTNMCRYMANGGFGRPLGNPGKLFLDRGWFMTHQFSLDVFFHNRVKNYQCLTNDPSLASAIFVPFYAGLEISRYLWDDNANISVRDSASLDLVKWLRERPEWNVMGGRDHFLVAGRITWDFRRGVEENSAWGNKLMLLPESKNMSILTIESSPWNRNDFGIPYPTCFHPSNHAEVLRWQTKMKRQRRSTLFAFAGAPRPHLEDSIREEIIGQCLASKRKCKFLECKNENNKCEQPVHVMGLFQTSVFCIQPPGDSFTRRSIFDSILAGCIPVFFSPGSAYVQYLWHLPKNFSSYSVLLPEYDVKGKKVSVQEILSEIPEPEVIAMREEVIRLIPSVIYADPRSRSHEFEDAFDLTVKGVLQRVETLRRELKEGKNTSFEFDEESTWKYSLFGAVGKHEWDHFFKRTNRTRY